MQDVEVVLGQGRALTTAQFFKLAEVPPEVEQFVNLKLKPVVTQFESSRATISSTDQTCLSIPASIAGVTLSVWCMRAKL